MTGPRLIGDIGGTNARFAIAQDGAFSYMRATRTAEHPSLLAAIRAYLSTLPAGLAPCEACLAIAGPIAEDTISLTNQAWSFSVSGMKTELGLAQMLVLNDFAATALAIPFLRPQDRLQIGPGMPVAKGPVAAIGPGTGLGVASLVPTPQGWLQLPGEGGHVTMCAATAEESRILDLLRDRFGHVSAERVLSGEGLVNLHQALCALRGEPPRPLTPSDVTEDALSGRDPDAVRALDLFCAMLGTVAGNLALTVGATGGIYIAGGILPRFSEHFAASAFRRRFEDKGRLAPFLAPIPTYLVLHPEAALLGLACMR